MNNTLNDIVEEILNLPMDEKEELKNILDRSLIEDTRNDILNNYHDTKQEEKKGQLDFYSNLKSLKKQL